VPESTNKERTITASEPIWGAVSFEYTMKYEAVLCSMSNIQYYSDSCTAFQ